MGAISAFLEAVAVDAAREEAAVSVMHLGTSLLKK
jgi:hypothetical protein